jgi:hypothetical protein
LCLTSSALVVIFQLRPGRNLSPDILQLTEGSRERMIHMERYEKVMFDPRGVKEQDMVDGYYEFYDPGDGNPDHVHD